MEIKFRAWAVFSRKMFYPDSDEGWEIKNGKIVPLPNTILMEYTNTEDIDEKEVWQGDIIKYGEDIGEIVMGKNNGSWCAYFPKIGTGIRTPLLNLMEGLMGCGPISKFKVIGNIHQDKELLD